MGVYIRGMEMPKGLEMLVVFSDGTVHKCLPGIKETLERSTAVPVLPHGRLIDADALKWNYIRIRDDGIKEFSQYGIDRAPTVIEKEPEEGEG